MGDYNKQRLLYMKADVCGGTGLTVTDQLGLIAGYEKLLAERDALAAELKAVKAWLPRWRKDGLAFRLSIGPYDRWVEPVGNGMWRATYIGTTRYSRADVMLAVTESLGLPPCEVEGE